MTTKILIEDRFACNPSKLCELLADNSFDDELMKSLNMKKECLEQKDAADGPIYKIRLTNPDPMPAIAVKFTGEKLAYVETRTWNKAKCSNSWEIAPEIKGTTVEAKGTTEIVADGHGCLRRTTGSVTVNLPLIGRKIEEMVEKSIRETFQKNADFCRKYIDEHNI